jgi:hypothetical protein
MGQVLILGEIQCRKSQQENFGPMTVLGRWAQRVSEELTDGSSSVYNNAMVGGRAQLVIDSIGRGRTRADRSLLGPSQYRERLADGPTGYFGPKIRFNMRIGLALKY